MELAKSLAQGFIATAQNPVNNFAFGHEIEVVKGEKTFMNHGTKNVGDELEGGAIFVAMVGREEGEAGYNELLANINVSEAEFVEILFVFKDGEILIKGFNLVESPSIKKEKAVG